MDKPSIDQVLEVINTLYRGADPTGKEKASEWLGHLQRSVRLMCWQLATSFLLVRVSCVSVVFAGEDECKVRYVLRSFNARIDQLKNGAFINLKFSSGNFQNQSCGKNSSNQRLYT